MENSHGMLRYQREFIVHQVITRARRQTRTTLPLSTGRAVRERVEQLGGPRVMTGDREADDKGLGDFLDALDQAMTEIVPGYISPFATHDRTDPALRSMTQAFNKGTDLHRGPDGRVVASGSLPLSPYDPRWSGRASVRAAGTALSYIHADDIDVLADGRPDLACEEVADNARVFHTEVDRDGIRRSVAAGTARSDEDAAGLTELATHMSEREYARCRDWVLDGGRTLDSDGRTGPVDRTRFMSRAALRRSLAVLDDLDAQGIDYEISPDLHPGQIKARLADSGIEIRLSDVVDPTRPGGRNAETYVGSRIYDDGVVSYYAVSGGRGQATTSYSPTPAEAVDLLHVAQGRPVARHDRPDITIGTAVAPAGGTRSGTRRRSDAYLDPSRGKTAMFAATTTRGRTGRETVFIHRDAADHTLPEYRSPETTRDYLQTMVSSARANFIAELGVDRLIEDYRRQVRDELASPDQVEMPEFSGDTEIAAIQRSYWDVLTGARTTLLRPGATTEMAEARLGEIGETTPDLGNLAYTGSAEEQIRAHASDAVGELIGTFEPEPHLVGDQWVDQRFDPIRVVRYADSSENRWTTLDSLAAACRDLSAEPETIDGVEITRPRPIGPGELLGTGFEHDRFADRLVRFSPTDAHPIETDPSSFIRAMGEEVRGALERNAVTPGDILIDDSGVIEWHGRKVFNRDVARSASGRDPVEVTGVIGQVFAPGDHGEIATRFASGDNSLIVPGYRARIAAQRPGEHLSVEERTLLRGYRQEMAEAISHRIGVDVLSGRGSVGDPTVLNRVYSRLYGTAHPLDHLERHTGPDGELDPMTAAVIDTEARRIRYGTEIGEGSTIYAEYAAAHNRGNDPADDNHRDPWMLTEGRNMVVLTGPDRDGVAPPAGYLDPMMTGSATNQGVVRYLTAGAEVTSDGRITPGDPDTAEGTRAPLMLRPELGTVGHDAFDRQLMATTNLMAASQVTGPTGTALMTFGGWGADDGIVVSREFAESHAINGADDEPRSLVVGDKLSDLHGNKGVISLIVDRQMDPDAAREQGLETEVAWFAANPGMDVVMSPFSLISRRNAGAGRELIDRPDDEIGRERARRVYEDIAAGRIESDPYDDDDEATVLLTELEPGETITITDPDGTSVEGTVVGDRDDAAGTLPVAGPDGVRFDVEAISGRSVDDPGRTVASATRLADRVRVAARSGVSFDAFEASGAGQDFVVPHIRSAAAGFRGDLVAPDGTVQEASVAPMRFIVTHMAVDEKTQIYDDEAVLAGKGRRASSQLAWALESAGADAVMREFYGSNSGTEADLREYLRVAGLTMDATGTLGVLGTDTDLLDDRTLIRTPELIHRLDRDGRETGRVDVAAMRRDFGALIGASGGDLEIPFPLTTPAGQTLPAGETPGTYRLPVLSSHLRAGMEFADGSTITHDYTRNYLDIYNHVVAWRANQERLDANRAAVEADDQPLLSNRDLDRLSGDQARHRAGAERAYRSLTRDITERVLNGAEKRNFFRTGLMANRLPDSATAVWTADPRLDIDQIAVGPDMARELDLSDGDTTLVWRDPILRDSGVRAMRVAVHDGLTGVAINPVSDKSFDGDFDGDSVAVVKLHSKAAIAQATEKLGVAANLVDRGVVDENGAHPLATQVSLDTKVALHRNPELADEFDSAVREANRLAAWRDRSEAVAELPDDRSEELAVRAGLSEIRASAADLTDQLSDLYRSAQRGEFGSALSFADEARHVASMQRVCVDTGAKGNSAKLDDYEKALRYGLTRTDQEQAMYATAVKAQGTGLGGSYSQRAVRALRDTDLKAVLELTQPVTQSILQVKHNAAEARGKYEALQGPGRALWRGQALAHDQGRWAVVRDAQGEPVAATTEGWKQQVREFYTSPDGFHVPFDPEYIDRIATALSDDRGRMRNLEEDPELAGQLLDRMAYGGSFEDLAKAAKNHENLFDGHGAELFACATTRRAREQAARDVQAREAIDDIPPWERDLDQAALDTPVSAPVAPSPAVTAPDTRDGGTLRGANRRSRYAPTLSMAGTRTPVFTDTESEDDQEMEL